MTNILNRKDLEKDLRKHMAAQQQFAFWNCFSDALLCLS